MSGDPYGYVELAGAKQDAIVSAERKRSSMAAAYELYVLSPLGLGVRSLAKPIPNSVILSSALLLICHYLFTPFYATNDNSKAGYSDYAYAVAGSGIGFFTASWLLDVYLWRKNYNTDKVYSSYHLFRLRTTLMGAVFSGQLLSHVIDHVTSERGVSPIVNFAMTLPLMMTVAFIRFRYYRHDIVPSPLRRGVSAKRIERSSSPSPTQGRDRQFFNSQAFWVLASMATAAGAGALMHESTDIFMRCKTPQEISWRKLMSTIVPAFIAGVTRYNNKRCKGTYKRWKQVEIFLSDAAISFFAFGILYNVFKDDLLCNQSPAMKIVGGVVCAFIGVIQARRFVPEAESSSSDVEMAERGELPAPLSAA